MNAQLFLYFASLSFIVLQNLNGIICATLHTQNYNVLPNPCGKDLMNTATHIHMQMSFHGKLFGRSGKLLILAKGFSEGSHYLNASGNNQIYRLFPTILSL